MFDLIAGTSTGGILALALTKRSPRDRSQPQYSAAELIDFYFENGPYIFEANFCHQIPLLHIASDAVEPRFPVRALEAALRQKFGNMKLSDAITEVLIPSYDLRGVNLVNGGPKGVIEPDAGGTSVFFARWKAQHDPKHCDFYARDVARATSAAPTYFEPFPRHYGNREAISAEIVSHPSSAPNQHGH